MTGWGKWFQHQGQPYAYESNALSQADLVRLREALLASPYLQRNVLNARFATTLGYSVIFQPSTHDTLLERFPELTPFVQKIYQPNQHNLFYLNVLAIGLEGQVERHIDHSIRGYGAHLPFPKRVSILYVDVPVMQGGELLLYHVDHTVMATLVPTTNRLIHLQGDLKHAIAPVTSLPLGSLRLSLVCEQYHLSRAELQHVPGFILKAALPFQDFLALEQDEIVRP